MKSILSTFFVLMTVLSRGQPNKSIVNSKYLNEYSFSKRQSEHFINLNYPFEHTNQNILKSNKKVYLTVDGTGFLFEFDSAYNKFNRIDSTRVFGYNYEAFVFSYNNEIYSLGGEGIWRQNGQLRKFNTRDREWDIVPLNKEIPVFSNYNEGLIWYDEAHGKIYSGFHKNFNAGLKESQNYKETTYDVMVLDLKSYDWVRLGELSSNNIKLTADINNIVCIPEGLITINNGEVYLWDFLKNKLLVNTNPKITYQTICRGTDTARLSYKEGKIYKTTINKIDSIQINLNDFVITNNIYSIYSNYIILIFTLLIILTLYIVYKIGDRKLYKYKINRNLIDYLDSEELEFIRLIFSNTTNGIKTTIDEINSFLIIESRNIETQKAQRHKIITSINKKYQLIYHLDLIGSARSEIDKRVFEYYINESEINIIKNLLKS